MIRRDNTQDAEKARNYSNFWIEVAMGKENSQGTSAVADDNSDLTDLADVTNVTDLTGATGMTDVSDLPDLEEFIAPAPAAKPAKSKPVEKKVEAPRSLSSFADLANIEALMKSSADLGDDAEVDLASDEAEDLDVPLTSDYNFSEVAEGNEPEAESLDEFADEDFDEEDEEEDTGWAVGRKPKQTKPQKPRREQRKPY
jgi:hypothetical protein